MCNTGHFRNLCLDEANVSKRPAAGHQIRMMSCANLLFNDRANEYIPLMSQGSGRVDVAKALVTKEYFNPPSLALKADMKGKQTAKCVLYNTSKTKAKATLSYWAVGKTTTCKLPDSVEIEPNKSTTFDIEVQCNPDTNDHP